MTESLCYYIIDSLYYCIAFTDPDFLFRARQASDFEDASTTSTLMFMSSVLPACPILLLGFLCLEGKDLVSQPDIVSLHFDELCSLQTVVSCVQ